MLSLSPQTVREIESLTEELTVLFSPPELIPGCEIQDITDKDQYDTNNGWIEATCGRHNQQRCRLKGQLNNPTVGDYIDVLYFPSTKLFEVYQVGGTSGVTGGTVFYGTGAPGGGVGTPGSFYFRDDTAEWYYKSGGAVWTKLTDDGHFDGTLSIGEITYTTSDGTLSVANDIEGDYVTVFRRAITTDSIIGPGPGITTQRARGDLGTPTTVVSGDITGIYRSMGYDGATYQYVTNVQHFAQTVGANMSGKIRWRTADTSGTMQNRMDLDEDGILNQYKQITVGGVVTVYGHATGSNVGGKLELELSDDYDATYVSWDVYVKEDDLYIEPNDNSAISNLFRADGNFILSAAANSRPINQLQCFSTTNSDNAALGFYKSDSNTINTWSTTANGEDLGDITWSGVDTGNSDRIAVSIRAEQDAAAGATFVQGRIAIFTRDSAGSLVEALRIDSAQDVYVPNGGIFVGTTDSVPGIITAYGNTTGNTDGGKLELEMAADYDGSYEGWEIKVVEDDFYINPVGYATDVFSILSNGVTYLQSNSASTAGNAPFNLYNANTTANNWAAINFVTDDNSADPDNAARVGCQFVARSVAGVSGDLVFMTANNANNPTERGRFLYSGKFVVGIDDDTAGTVLITGDGTSSLVGGKLQLWFAADYDTSYEGWEIYSYGTTLNVGLEGSGTSVLQGVSTGINIYNVLQVGQDDTVYGLITAFGQATGSTQGGELRLHTAADYDGSCEYWVVEVYQDDLLIWAQGGGPSFDFKQEGILDIPILGLNEQSADPANPGTGKSVIWQSDGTGSGDDGDIMIKITDSGGTTKTTTLVDYSAI